MLILSANLSIIEYLFSLREKKLFSQRNIQYIFNNLSLMKDNLDIFKF